MASFVGQQSNPTTTCATPRSRWNRSQSQSENETALNGKWTRFEQALRGAGRSLTPGWWILTGQNSQACVPSDRYKDEKGHSASVSRTVGGGLDSRSGSGRVAVVPVWRGAWQPRVLSAVIVGSGLKRKRVETCIAPSCSTR